MRWSQPLRALPFICLSACATASGFAIGPRLPPRPPDCKLSYERFAPADVPSSWRQIGAVCVASPQGIRWAETYEPGDERDLLTERACELGAQMVTPAGFCSGGRMNGVEFGAYVAR